MEMITSYVPLSSEAFDVLKKWEPFYFKKCINMEKAFELYNTLDTVSTELETAQIHNYMVVKFTATLFVK